MVLQQNCNILLVHSLKTRPHTGVFPHFAGKKKASVLLSSKQSSAGEKQHTAGLKVVFSEKCGKHDPVLADNCQM